MSNKILLLALVPMIIGVVLVTFLNENNLNSKILPTYSVISFGGSDTEIFLEKTSAIIEENKNLQLQRQAYEEKINQAEQQQSDLADQLSNLQSQIKVVNDLKSTSDQKTEQLELEMKKLQDQVAQFKTTATTPSSTPEQLAKIAELEKKIKELETSQNQTDVSSLYDELSGFEQQVATPTTAKPAKVTMDEKTISWSFTDSKGIEYSFSKPTDEFIDQVIKLPSAQDTLEFNLDSGPVKIKDLSKFVVGSIPGGVMDELYNNAESDDQFIFEIWFILSQFHVTSTNMQGDPKYPLDTFSKVEGDNEDLAILFADMLKSSSVAKSWQVKFLYFDSDNISKPQKINHVVLVIDNGKTVWLVDPTAKTIDEAFKSKDRIRGHIFSVD